MKRDLTKLPGDNNEDLVSKEDAVEKPEEEFLQSCTISWLEGERPQFCISLSLLSSLKDVNLKSL